MFIEANKLAAGTRIEADICIVGAGAAGITLARDLSNGRRKVAVIESGGFEYQDDVQQLNEGDSIGRPFNPLVLDRLRYLGGTTNHWEGGCTPFPEFEFKARSDVAESGWPFGRETLDPYYHKAQAICQLGPFKYEPEYWQSEDIRPFSFSPNAGLTTGVFQYSPPTRFGQVYRRDLETLDGVSVHLGANLVDIDTDEGAREVAGLGLMTLDGRRFSAIAKCYVLATGGIENARLLLNATKVQKEGLGNRYDLVGRYFMDHAYIQNAATLSLNEPGSSVAFYLDRSARGQRIGGYVTALEELMQDEHLSPFFLQFHPGTLPDKEMARASLFEIFRRVAAGQVPDHLGDYLDRVFTAVRWAGAAARQKLFDASSPLFSVAYCAGGPPDPDSRVTLNDKVDRLGLRRVTLDWRLPPDFEAQMHSVLELFGRQAGSAGLGRLRIGSRDTGDDPMASMRNCSHEMGTTRMHRDPRHGVVDENCRVHGMSNLYIAGSSVFPTYCFDCPTMTLVALALKLSDHLKNSAL
jgi:choline dehydrogenase-like flavoprotein